MMRSTRNSVLSGRNSVMNEFAAGVVYAVGDVGMSDVLADKFAWKQAIEGPLSRMRSMFHSRLLLSGILALGSMIALAPSALFSQAAPAENAPAVRHGPPKKAVAAPIPEPAPPPQPTVAPSLFEQPPAPATVTAHPNELTVKADNSSLTQILHQVSSATGMRLDGLGGDERVFGSFGPGVPREVLTTLLNGTSYNVVMVGDLPNGAPRELLLSHRASGGASPQPAASANQNQTHSGDEDNPDDSGSSDDSEEPPPMQYSPPSIAPATPETPGAPGGAPQTPDAPQRIAPPQMPVQNAPQ
jgi:hypothetical protein